MYAIVDIAGQQIKVKKEQQVFVNRLDGKEDSNVYFDQVLLLDNDGKITVGTPLVEGAGVTARIVQHLKADKVIVFKKRKRKGYQVSNGHRQLLTKIHIEDISPFGDSNKTAKKQAVSPEAGAETAVTTPKEKKPAGQRPTAAKKAASKSENPKANATKKSDVQKTSAKKSPKKDDK